jgi:hypothetical protein
VLVFSALWCIVACIWVYRTVRREPQTSLVVDRREEIGALLDGDRSGSGEGRARAGLGRRPIDAETAEVLFAALSLPGFEYDPLLYFRPLAGLESPRKFEEHPDGGWKSRTNSLGMHDDDDPLTERPDLRVLVAGDSQTQGVCANSETVASELERRLLASGTHSTVEVLNAAVGGYGPFNYLGTIEHFRHLAPDVFLVVVYGGNDFRDLMRLQRYFARRGAASIENHDPVAIAEQLGERRRMMYAELSQLCYFLDNPGDVRISVDTLSNISLAIARECEQVGARPVFAFLPGPLTSQPERHARDIERFLEVSGLAPEALEVNAQMAADYVAFLAANDLAHVDLRAALRAADEPLFWDTDLHLNLDGNRLVARELAAGLSELLSE